MLKSSSRSGLHPQVIVAFKFKFFSLVNFLKAVSILTILKWQINLLKFSTAYTIKHGGRMVF